MSKDPSADQAKHGQAKRAQARARRLATALRENLRRRKAQARGKADQRSEETGSNLDKTEPRK
jgi:hypothetical protein